MNVLLKGFKDENLSTALMLVKRYKTKFLTPERMGLRRGVIHMTPGIPGTIYIYHTKTQIVAVHSKG